MMIEMLNESFCCSLVNDIGKKCVVLLLENVLHR